MPFPWLVPKKAKKSSSGGNSTTSGIQDSETTCRYCEKSFPSRTKMMKHAYSDICRTTIPAEAHAALQETHNALVAA